jgi:hypothetical protein
MKIKTTANEMLAFQLDKYLTDGYLTDIDRKNLRAQAVCLIAVAQADAEELQRQLDAIDEPDEQLAEDANHVVTNMFITGRYEAIMKQLGFTSDMMPDWYNESTKGTT